MAAVAEVGVLVDDGPMSIGRFLKAKRVKSGVSQKALADAVGVSLSLIKRYEQDGGPVPPVDKAAKIAKIIGFEPRDLFAEALDPGSMAEAAGADDDAPVSRRHLQSLVRSLGGHVVFDGEPGELENEGEEGLDRDDFSSAEIALEKLRVLVGEKGINARRLPDLIRQAEDALSLLDLDELIAMAEAHEAEIVECPLPKDVEGMLAEERDLECEKAQARLIIEAVYSDGLNVLSSDELDKLAAPFRDEEFFKFLKSDLLSSDLLDEDMVRDKGWIESSEDFEDRLRRGLPPLLIEAIKKRRPVVQEGADNQPSSRRRRRRLRRQHD